MDVHKISIWRGRFVASKLRFPRKPRWHRSSLPWTPENLVFAFLFLLLVTWPWFAIGDTGPDPRRVIVLNPRTYEGLVPFPICAHRCHLALHDAAGRDSASSFVLAPSSHCANCHCQEDDASVCVRGRTAGSPTETAGMRRLEYGGVNNYYRSTAEHWPQPGTGFLETFSHYARNGYIHRRTHNGQVANRLR